MTDSCIWQAGLLEIRFVRPFRRDFRRSCARYRRDRRHRCGVIGSTRDRSIAQYLSTHSSGNLHDLLRNTARGPERIASSPAADDLAINVHFEHHSARSPIEKPDTCVNARRPGTKPNEVPLFLASGIELRDRVRESEGRSDVSRRRALNREDLVEQVCSLQLRKKLLGERLTEFPWKQNT
jgi:hypothetical protein